MPIIPTGSPAWTRTAVHTQYGGHLEKQNYLSEGVIDAETDVGAAELCRLAADMEALVRAAPFAVVTYLANDSSVAAPTIESVFMMTGVRNASYAGNSAPGGYPSGSRTSTGRNLITFDGSFSDPYGVAAAWVPSHAIAAVHGTGSAAVAVCTISGSSVDVRVFDASGSVASNKRVTLSVW